MSLIVGGDSELGTGSKTEAIEIPNVNIWSNLPDFPNETLTGILGMRNENSIVICNSASQQMECHSLDDRDLSTADWIKMNFTLEKDRLHAATVPLFVDNEWLITGGAKDTSEGISILDSSEIFKNKSFTPGPQLPEAVSMHCMIPLNYTHIISTGGRGAGSKPLYSVNAMTREMLWKQLPNLVVARYGHSCGHYKGEDIIVAGGLNIQSSEIYSMIYQQW